MVDMVQRARRGLVLDSRADRLAANDMGDGERHIGTYAQDFKATTGKGDGHSIPVIDAIGVTKGAVKELDAKVEKLAKGLPAYDRKGGEPMGRGGRGIR
ncbi:hypothetical protein [Xanthobacter autotrophicus]|uniref:hypothetical protein n=1 Tax=Xanthobacter autotrophicus TaxID=280 RepID=UPI003729781E